MPSQRVIERAALARAQIGTGAAACQPAARAARWRAAALVDQAVKAGLFKRQHRDHRLEWMLKSGGADIVLAGIQAGISGLRGLEGAGEHVTIGCYS